MSIKHKRSFQSQAEQNIKDEALRIATGIQTAGQTKEQTRRIAQGIEKGIALYKKQANEKARERERQRKKQDKHTTDQNDTLPQADPSARETGRTRSSKPHNRALIVAGLIFSLISVLHVARYFTGLSLIVGTTTVPVTWSLPAAAVSALLAGWMFHASRR